MDRFRALAFLEMNFARNNLRSILRAPQRLIIWVPTTLALFVLYVYRIDRPAPHPTTVRRFSHSVAGAAHDLAATGANAFAAAGGDALLHRVVTSCIAYLLIAIVAVAAALALGGRTAVFRSSAEAVLFSNVGMPPLLVAVWLQTRKLLSSFRVLTAALYVFVFMTPTHESALSATRGLGLALLSFAIPTCVQLPAFLLRRLPFADALQGVAWGLATLAAGAGASVLLLGEPALAWLGRAHVDPGGFAASLAAGDPLPAAAIGAVVIALCASIAILGRDAMPDFYRATTQAMVKRSARPRPDAARASAVRASRWKMPTGATAYVWKDWIAFRRGRGKFTLWIATLSFWCVVGTVTSLTQSRSALGILALTCFMFLLGVAPVTAGEDLANDLSKPLFWLSRDSVYARVAAITFGRAARTGLALGVAPLCASVLDGNLTLAISALPLAIVFAWALQAMGTALFAYFPADLDQRGPIVYVRLVLGFVFLLPVPFFSSLGFVSLGWFGAVAGALLTAAIEGAAALWLASERFERRGGYAYGRFGARG